MISVELMFSIVVCIVGIDIGI